MRRLAPDTLLPAPPETRARRAWPAMSVDDQAAEGVPASARHPSAPRWQSRPGRGRQPIRRLQENRDPLLHAESNQTGCGENGGMDTSLLDFIESGRNVAAELD